MSGSIRDRMAAQLEFMEKQIWNGFLHAGEDLVPYLSKNYFGDHDAVIILWDGNVLDGKSIEKFFTKQYGVTTTKWMTYEMGDVSVIEVDMMAGVIYYGIVATRLESESLILLLSLYFEKRSLILDWNWVESRKSNSSQC